MNTIIATVHSEKLPYPELCLYVVLFTIVICVLSKFLGFITDGLWNKGSGEKRVLSQNEGASNGGEGMLDPRIVAVITAAVYTTIGEGHKVISIKTNASSIWAQEGRRQQFQNKI